MRFYRRFFWVVAVYHLLLSVGYGFTPHLAIAFMGYAESMPHFALQIFGLFYLVMACGFAYVAERPSKSIAIVSLGALAKILTPLVVFVGHWRGELPMQATAFHVISDLVLLPVIVSYFFWFYHVPRPSSFLPMMGIFSKRDEQPSPDEL